MHKEDFLTVLKQDFPEDKYKDRLLRELSDHLKDSSSNQDPAEAEERLGDPHEFITFYQMVMRKNWQLYLEALFIGLCSMPLILLPFIGNAFTEVTESLPAKGVLWVFTLGCEAFLYFSFYRWVWARLGGAEKVNSSLAKRLFPLLTLPSWYALVLVAFLVMMDQYQDRYFPLVLASYAVVQGVAAWKARTKAFSEKDGRRIAVLGFALIVTLFVMLPALSGTPLSEALFTLFFFVRVGLFLPFGGEYATAIMVLGIFALLMAAYSFFSVIQSLLKGHQFTWGKAAVGFLMLYGFVTPAVPSDLISWQYNAVNITQAWEERRLSVFYPWYLFLTNDGERTFQYAVEETDAGIRIVDQGDHRIQLTTMASDAKWLDWERDEKDWAFLNTQQDAASRLNEILSTDSLPQGATDLTCEDSSIADAFGNSFGKVSVLGGQSSCEKFYYKDQLIFDASVGVLVREAFVTRDGQWLILHFPEQAWGPGSYQHDSVFAVELDASFN